MKLSIVTITYNVENSIARTMESVLNQEIPVYEYILVDGLSTDRTNDVIELYHERFEDKGIVFRHISERDRGISDAFNKGIMLATGDVIGLINSDDELMPYTNRVLQENYQENIDVLYGNCLWVDEVNHISYERRASIKLVKIRYEMVLIHPSTFVKKKSYEKYGLFDTSYLHCMDEELLTRFYESGARFKYINEQLTKFKAGGISDKGITTTLREGLRLALDCERPNRVRAYGSYFYRYIRYLISSKIKRMGLFRIVKRDIKKID